MHQHWATVSPAPCTAPGLGGGGRFQAAAFIQLTTPLSLMAVIHEHPPALLPAALLPPPSYFHEYLIDVKYRLGISLFLLLTMPSKRRKIGPVCLSYDPDA